MQHKRGGEEDCKPEKPRAKLARLLRRGADGEAEENENDQNEDDGGGKEFPGAELGAQFLAEKCGGVREEAHGVIRPLRR